MQTTSITVKGQVVIPVAIRRRLKLKKGMRLAVDEMDNVITLKPITPEYFARMAGVLATGGKLTRALLAERARERRREE